MNRLVVLGSLFLVSHGQAQSLDVLFEEANQAAFEERFDDAIAGYDRLLASGVADSDVEYNLATVHAQAGHYGSAIRHFERTLRLAPGDDDAERALSDVRRVLADRRARAEGEAEIDEGGGFGEALVRPFTEDVLAFGVLGLELLLLMLLVVRARSQGGVRLGATLVSGLVGLLFLGAGLGLALERGVFHEGQDAIVVRDRVPMRQGPDPRAGSRSEAREGDWARVVDEDEGFVLVRIAGQQGWVETDAIGAI